MRAGLSVGTEGSVGPHRVCEGVRLIDKGSWMGQMQTGTSHLFVHRRAKQLLLKGEEEEVWRGCCIWISKQISLEQ